jgi:hypothetical protein
MSGFNDRRAEAAGRLEALRRERGVALLDGKPFADEEIIAAEQELDALTEAEAEAATREREREAAAWIEDLRERVRVELMDKEAERQAAVMRAEKAARALVAGLAEVMTVAAEMRELVRKLGKPVPINLDKAAMTVRLSQRLAAVLGSLPGHPGGFGHVAVHPTWRKPEENWAERERAELSLDLDKLTKGN